ncbi:uncharacterized protein MYCFIDRAFT_173580 [Pseudocercospora fijiensis CIRAD86]|uniref:Uncharacterized protein n=1 Tax=Pseudocercospora fijiensis (strain CIRAD86) TaxID=383855 RepID=M3AJ65_PSEFD|nr:uncharacterized protein MYCFIDRAFT_173580 [Pseudocercospora fijiensis CIRAD86]EME84631.1 hypothetical protein MYCFIDRAFT_173580 [Pseudocercospora fijiensis CIRAD86]
MRPRSHRSQSATISPHIAADIEGQGDALRAHFSQRTPAHFRKPSASSNLRLLHRPMDVDPAYMSYPLYYPTGHPQPEKMQIPQYEGLREMIKSNAAMVFPIIGKDYTTPEDFDIVISSNVTKKNGFFGYTSRSYNASLVYGPHREHNIAAVGRAAKTYEDALDELLDTLSLELHIMMPVMWILSWRNMVGDRLDLSRRGLVPRAQVKEEDWWKERLKRRGNYR